MNESAPTIAVAEPGQDETTALERLPAALDSLRAQIDEMAALVRMAVDEAAGKAAPPEEEDVASLRDRHARDRALLDALARHAARHDVAPMEQQLEPLRTSELFDGLWYLRSYPDVAESGIAPAEHYVGIGAFEGRNPGPDFDTVAYYTANPDVFASGWPALVHYLLYGRAENRPLAPARD